MAAAQYTIGEKVEFKPKYGSTISGTIEEIVYIIKRDEVIVPHVNGAYESQRSSGRSHELAVSSPDIARLVEGITYDNVKPGIITKISTEGGSYKKAKYSKKTRRNRRSA